MTNLVAPHGSDILKPLIIKDKSEKDNIITQSKNLHQLKLNSAAAANAVMLAAGYFTPLEGYMNKKDALSVSENMVTTNGLFWPVPIINLTKEDITTIFSFECPKMEILEEYDIKILSYPSIKDICSTSSSKEEFFMKFKEDLIS